ncbi:DUF6541 family protein [Microbacterium stercoris]|uniref:Uncharacterized protein n=1 Tax=Microbacterium stercoris TaxID=2820289 RepID=A0A939QSX1_9MICO|nr:DUF6541 family protein [Microbacterium stercoris]MBO3664971.1 hypothetical protein [Microbacterium stercoris]
MILDWIDSLPALAFAIALLVLPGLPAAWLAGFRGPLLIGIGSVGSLAIIAASSLAAPVVGLRWSLVPVLIGTVVLSLVVGIVAGFRRGGRPAIRSQGWLWLVGAAVVWIALMAYSMTRPSLPIQNYDGLYHLNAVRFVLDTGDASSFHQTLAYPESSSVFYPALWHAYTALVVPVAGGVFEATNLVIIAACAVLWPASVMLLTAAVWPKQRIAILAAPVLTLGISFFPMGFLNWGPLLPNLLGNALVPAILALIVWILRTGVAARDRFAHAVLLLGAAGACALGHPSSLLLALVFAVPIFAERVIGLWREGRGTRTARVAWTVALVVAAAAIAVIWVALRRVHNEWLPNQSPAQGLGEALLLAPMSRPIPAVIVVLGVVGAIVAIRRAQGRWLLVTHAVGVFFFLCAVSLLHAGLRELIVGIWYSDLNRAAATLVVASLPLAARGVEPVLGAVRTWWAATRQKDGLARIARIGVALVALAALLGPQFLAVRNETKTMRIGTFNATDEATGLSPDEEALFAEAERLLPDDALVVGSPLTATGLLYAATGIRVVFPHILGDWSDDADLLGKRLRFGGADVCDAINRMGVTHALDFGEVSVFPPGDPRYTGLDRLERSPVLTEIASSGDAKLFEVTGCGDRD